MPRLSEALVEGYDPAAEAACGRSAACHFRFILLGLQYVLCFLKAVIAFRIKIQSLMASPRYSALASLVIMCRLSTCALNTTVSHHKGFPYSFCRTHPSLSLLCWIGTS